MVTQTRKTMRGMLVACLMAVSMLLSPVLSVYADPVVPDKGTLIIEKRLNGSQPGVADGTLVNGMIFKLYKVTIVDGVPNGIPATGTGISYRLVGSNLKVYDSSNVEIGSYAVTPAAIPSVTTAGQGRATAVDLPQGLYLVVEDLLNSSPVKVGGGAFTVGTAAPPFLVSIPMTNPNGDGWLTTVTVVPKNVELSIDKEVAGGPANGNAVAVGDVLNYKITTSVPGDIATGQAYRIVDKMDIALSYVNGSVTLKPLPGGTTSTLVANTHYTVTFSDQAATVGPPAVPAKKVMTIAFTTAGMQALEGYQFVEVNYSAEVNSNILDMPGYSAKNNASVTFTNEAGESYTAGTGGGGEVEVEVHTAAIQVTKVDQNNAVVNGATFAIASSRANALAGVFLRIDGNGKILDTGAAGYAAATDIVITPNNVASFTGLRDKDNNVLQTYYIVELSTPSGYNLLAEPITVTFTGNEASHTYTLTVVNSSQFTLPTTGGTGTVIFTVSGLALIALALIIAFGKNRRQENVVR